MSSASAPAIRSVSFVVPIYNEAGNIPLMYERIVKLRQTLPYATELVMVDDGSRDGSLQEMEALAAQDPSVKLVVFKRNFGQTAAMSAGIEYAAGDVIITMDGDLQNDPADVPRLLAKLDEGYDLVSGWRKDRKDKTLSRKVPSWIANWVISRVGGVPLHDYGCSLKAYRAEFVKDIRLYGEMHRFIPIYAKWQGARITEMVVQHHPRTIGKSKYGINRTFKVILDLLLIKFIDKYFQKPIYIFGNFALWSIALGVLSFGAMIFRKFMPSTSSWHADFVQTPLPALTVMFVLIGVLAFFLGLVAEMNNRIYFESQNKRPFEVRRTQNLNAPPAPPQTPKAA